MVSLQKMKKHYNRACFIADQITKEKSDHFAKQPLLIDLLSYTYPFTDRVYCPTAAPQPRQNLSLCTIFRPHSGQKFLSDRSGSSDFSATLSDGSDFSGAFVPLAAYASISSSIFPSDP